MCFWTRWKIKRLRKKIDFFFTERQHNAASELALKKECALLLKLAVLYDKNAFNKKIPRAKTLALETYRAAGRLNDPQAQYIVGERLLSSGRFWLDMQKTFYTCKVYEKYASDYCNEAFAYLQSAESLGNPRAKRLRGLALVQGWGQAAQPELGFQWIIESIDAENAWDKSTQIIEELNLNKPAFFAYLANVRK